MPWPHMAQTSHLSAFTEPRCQNKSDEGKRRRGRRRWREKCNKTEASDAWETWGTALLGRKYKPFKALLSFPKSKQHYTCLPWPCNIIHSKLEPNHCSSISNSIIWAEKSLCNASSLCMQHLFLYWSQWWCRGGWNKGCGKNEAEEGGCWAGGGMKDQSSVEE